VIACSETVEHPFALVHDRQETTVVGVILVWSAVSPRKVRRTFGLRPGGVRWRASIGPCAYARRGSTAHMNETTTDPDGARVDRSPLWILFFLFGALLGAHAIYLMVLPSADPDHWRAFTRDPEMIAYLTDDFRASGAMQLGFAIMSMTIAGRWFRLGDRWAWVLFWYFPVLFAWSIFTTWAVGLFLMLTLVAVAALVATHRQFYKSDSPG
jgi:hypothetical protein